MSEPIGLFGGTFDPIHYGHLRTAFELWQSLKLAQVRFLPTGSPPHREAPLASSELRLEMVRAAVAGQPGFTVDDREIRWRTVRAGRRPSRGRWAKSWSIAAPAACTRCTAPPRD
jgi:cytidyltransferase-like protein